MVNQSYNVVSTAPPPLISHLYQDILKRVGEGGGGRDKSSLPGVNRVRMYDTYMLMCL